MNAQNSRVSATKGVRGRPFVKGVSGNPGGRPRGFVQAIREATADGEELVHFMLRVLRGKVPGVRLRDRLEAATWLADRGFGRPTPMVERENEFDVQGFIAALGPPRDPNEPYDG